MTLPGGTERPLPPGGRGWERKIMAPLRTGKRYEIVFGPGINLATAAQGGAIDLAFEQVCGVDPTAVVLSAASDGLMCECG